MSIRLPNIVLIVIDAGRPDHFSSYGYHRETTPFLTELANRGHLYLSCFASSSWTVPSHASLFTGKHVYEHRLFGRTLSLPDSFPTLAEVLSDSGYETVIASGNSLLGKETGLSRGFDQKFFFRELSPDNPLSRFSILNRALGKFRLEHYKDKGAAWITRRLERWARNRRRTQRPFFLFINYLDAHLPYVPQRQFRELFLEPEKEKRAAEIEQNPIQYYLGNSQLTSEDFEILQALYDAELRYVDTHIEQLYRNLTHYNLNGNTLWIITSDHGENIGEHGMIDHQFSILDTLIRVPLIIHSPNLPLTVERKTALVQQKDLYPCIIEFTKAQGNTAPTLQERTYCLSEYLQSPLAAFDTRTLEYRDSDKLSHLFHDYRAIRTEEFKLVEVDGGKEYWLFNIKDDPGEKHDIASEQPGIVKALQAILEQHQLEQDLDRTMNDKELAALEQQLRSLGYI